MVPKLRSRFVIVAHSGKGMIVGELVSYVGDVSLRRGNFGLNVFDIQGG